MVNLVGARGGVSATWAGRHVALTPKYGSLAARTGPSCILWRFFLARSVALRGKWRHAFPGCPLKKESEAVEAGNRLFWKNKPRCPRSRSR